MISGLVDLLTISLSKIGRVSHQESGILELCRASTLNSQDRDIEEHGPSLRVVSSPFSRLRSTAPPDESSTCFDRLTAGT